MKEDQRVCLKDLTQSRQVVDFDHHLEDDDGRKEERKITPFVIRHIAKGVDYFTEKD